MQFGRHSLYYSSLALFVGSICLTSVTATNADFAPTTLVDFFVLGSAFLILAQIPRAPSLFSISEKTLLAVLGLLFLIVATRYVFSWQQDYFEPSLRCLAFEPLIPKFECLVSLSFRHNYGLRQIITHLTAITVFCAVYFTAKEKSRDPSLKFLWGPFQIWAVFALLGASGIFLSGLIGENFVAPQSQRFRGLSAVISNPGWLWPLLAPGFALCVGGCFSTNRKLRIVCVLNSILVLLVYFLSAQRGAFALVGLYLVVVVFYSVFKFIKHRQVAIAVAVSLLLSCFGTAYYLIAHRYYGMFTLAMGMRYRTDTLDVSRTRLRLWKVGLVRFLEAPWFGHGYASWTHVDRRITFPTAHNLWVQLLVEHGFIFTSCLFALIVFFIYLVLRSTRLSTPVRLGALLFFIAFFLTSLVQEVDHVNTVYYQFAMVAGLVGGLANSREASI